MVLNTKIGNQGYTLIEVLVVLMIVVLFAGISVPVVENGISSAKEATLRATLRATRNAIDDYFADHQRYPESLAELQSAHYLRALPVDPYTGNSTDWAITEGEGGGVSDLHSGAVNEARDGSLVNTW